MRERGLSTSLFFAVMEKAETIREKTTKLLRYRVKTNKQKILVG